ncbi:Glutathione S-transferase-1 [Aphelenchoides fujianensis]|nr:Glutathione S-transferase-1 [Aphelenchoides fujianensis]
MSTYVLHGYEFRGLGEVIRLVLVQAGIPFEDRRMSAEEWARIKETYPNSQVPLLEVDGRRMAQSGYEFYYDRVAEHVPYNRVLLGFDQTSKREDMYERHFLPAVRKALPFYEELVRAANENDGFILASGLSYADFVVAEHLHTIFAMEPKFAAKNPELAAFRAKIFAVSPQIAAHIRDPKETVA